jgi:TIR domain
MSSTSVPGASALRPTTGLKPEAPDAVRIFISYAAADVGIATALFEELREIDRNRVSCFLDTQSIGTGRDWEDQLNRALEEAHWLVCVYTGEQSEFCGYEMGVFSKVNNLLPGAEDSRLVCLHDVPTLPTVFHSHQNRLVVFPPDSSAESNPLNEVEFYTSAPLARFFSDIYKFKDLYVARDVAESQRQVQTLLRQVKRITDAFNAARGSDVRSDTPTQLRVEVSMPGTRDQKLLRIPPESQVAGTFQSLALFGLMPPMQNNRLPSTTWGEIQQACGSQYRRIPPWMERVERDMLDAGTGRVLSGLESTFSYKDKIYRTILSRHILFENGNHKFEVLFVETLPRQFVGKRNTSLILAGLVLASRFRFTYLEEPDAVAAKFADDISDSEFEANCWQLYYDLERLTHEAIELGLLDPLEFIKAFGVEKRAYAEALLKSSAESRDKLLSAYPPPDAKMLHQDRERLRGAIQEYLKEMEPVNSRFLTGALEVYADELKAQLRNRK